MQKKNTENASKNVMPVKNDVLLIVVVHKIDVYIIGIVRGMTIMP